MAAEVWLRARTAAAPAVPLPVHPDEQVLAHFVDVIAPGRDVHVAEADGRIVAVLALHDGWLQDLYVLPEHTGQRLGSQLVHLAQELHPQGLQLWAFQSNVRAIAFYERHGFVQVERTDGATNMERAPDVRMVWPGAGGPPPYEVDAVNIDPSADNRIHDDDVAQQFGFAGALVPGVEVFAVATAPLVAAWGETFLSAGRLAVRFRRPVYDGERVRVEVDGDALSVVGPDGTTRATGSVARPVAQPAPPPYDEVPLPEQLAAAPSAGPFGTVRQVAEPDACAEYVLRIGEPSPLYDRLVHPGLLLRLVNLALMSNVELGPWIHTASDCRFLGLARVGQELSVHSRVRELFKRKAHSYVRYDALVLADGQPVAEVDHEAIWRLAGQGDEPQA